MVEEFEGKVHVGDNRVSVLTDCFLDDVILVVLGGLMGDMEEFTNTRKAIDQASGGLIGLSGDALSAIGGSCKVFHHLEEFPYRKGVEGFVSIKTIHNVY